jgi:hypothetical protein
LEKCPQFGVHNFSKYVLYLGGRRGVHAEFLWGNLLGIVHFGDPEADRRLMLKLILGRYVMRMEKIDLRKIYCVDGKY